MQERVPRQQQKSQPKTVAHITSFDVASCMNPLPYSILWPWLSRAVSLGLVLNQDLVLEVFFPASAAVVMSSGSGDHNPGRKRHSLWLAKEGTSPQGTVSAVALAMVPLNSLTLFLFIFSAYCCRIPSKSVRYLTGFQNNLFSIKSISASVACDIQLFQLLVTCNYGHDKTTFAQTIWWYWLGS